MLSPVMPRIPDTILRSNYHQQKKKQNLNQVFIKINEWFNANLLSLNYSKTYYMQFKSTNQTSLATNINNNIKLVQNTTKLKFLGLLIVLCLGMIILK
jgi:hypothetical protein